uniref:Nitroreductase domain-containing protein n=1 Tax=Steinernema glaseri TaxID=37863 RepID=A0A1I7Y0L9_9BILA
MLTMTENKERDEMAVMSRRNFAKSLAPPFNFKLFCGLSSKKLLRQPLNAKDKQSLSRGADGVFARRWLVGSRLHISPMSLLTSTKAMEAADKDGDEAERHVDQSDVSSELLLALDASIGASVVDAQGSVGGAVGKHRDMLAILTSQPLVSLLYLGETHNQLGMPCGAREKDMYLAYTEWGIPKERLTART